MMKWVIWLLSAAYFLSVKQSLAAEDKKEAPAAEKGAPTAPVAVSSWEPFVDAVKKWKINRPSRWKITKPEEGKTAGPLVVGFAKPDQTAMVNVLAAKSDGKRTATQILDQMDQARKATNLIPSDKRKIAADVLKKMNAEDGALGYYEIAGAKPVLQRSLVVRRQKETLVLTATFQKAREGEDDPLTESILTSFQFTP